MKANSKRRVLVSSVAMLLVALISLSTATFAWFTSSTTVTAKGINVKTVKSSELVISDKSRAWAQEVDYGLDGKTFRPASSANGIDWYEGTAEKKGGYAIKTGDKFTSVTGQSGYYFVDELNVANKGAAAVKDVTIEITGFNNNYGRIALVPEGGTFADAIIDVDGEEYAAVTGANTTTAITPTTTKTITVGTLAGKAEGAELGGAVYYDLYVWFEGQDTDCFDTNAGQEIGNIEFSVSGTTVVE